MEPEKAFSAHVSTGWLLVAPGKPLGYVLAGLTRAKAGLHPLDPWVVKYLVMSDE